MPISLLPNTHSIWYGLKKSNFLDRKLPLRRRRWARFYFFLLNSINQVGLVNKISIKDILFFFLQYLIIYLFVPTLISTDRITTRTVPSTILCHGTLPKFFLTQYTDREKSAGWISVCEVLKKSRLWADTQARHSDSYKYLHGNDTIWYPYSWPSHTQGTNSTL